MDMVRRLTPRIIADKDATQLDAFTQDTAGLSLRREAAAAPRAGRGFDGDLPLRGELYSSDQLQRHARMVATAHRLTHRPPSGRLLRRLADNERVLLETYELLAASASRGRRVAPASEWLLDNFYFLEEQIHSTRRLLPRSYLHALPALGADCPRTYRIAMELVAHTDGRVDAGALDAFVAAYQSVAPLTLGELWSLPLMLRLALVENLRRVAVLIGVARRHRDLAADWADRMLRAAETRPGDVVVVLAEMTRAAPPLTGAFLAEFTRSLQGHTPGFALAGTWLEHCLADQGASIEQLVLAEGQSQAADQVSIGNSIGSLRFLAVHDWRDFVSRHSIVEQVLGDDPAGVYARMDFTTRNRYRTSVESLARRTGHGEEEVARQAVTLAAEARQPAADSPPDTPLDTPRGDAQPPREAHVGYWLVDDGHATLARSLGARCWPWQWCVAAARHAALCLLLAAVAALTAAATWAFVAVAGREVWTGPPLVPIAALLVALHLGVGLATWAATLLVRPHPLPRLDFTAGIPADHRTLVAVPAMLSSPATIDRLLESLEIRFLANRDPHLHFALLSDLPDADAETLPGDEELIRRATAGIDALNRRYAVDRCDHFLLLHRSREWNDRDRIWMGRERKRGKLADLNATLRGAVGRFSHVTGDPAFLRDVRYVLSLDADTDLPRDAAREMAGAMAHILNRPVPHPTRAG